MPLSSRHVLVAVFRGSLPVSHSLFRHLCCNLQEVISPTTANPPSSFTAALAAAAVVAAASSRTAAIGGGNAAATGGAPPQNTGAASDGDTADDGADAVERDGSGGAVSPPPPEDWMERFECVSSPDAVGARGAWARPPTSPLAESVFSLPSPPASEVKKAILDVNATSGSQRAGAEITPLSESHRGGLPNAPRTLKL